MLTRSRWLPLVALCACLPRATGPAPELREDARYRLLLPPGAQKQKPRVAVWLHPEGSAGVELVEPLAPLLARHGFALLVPQGLDVRRWTSADATQLFGATVPAAAAKHGLSTEQPLLVGYSAGAQMALHLWHSAPERWAGLVLVAGAPQLTTAAGAEDLVFEDAWRYAGTPLLSIAGERDPSAAKWRSVLDKWKNAGVPLDYKQVPNVDHTWCVGAFEQERIDHWLESLSAPVAK